MRQSVRDGLDFLLVRTPLQWSFARRQASRLAVLAYHGIDDPAAFRRHLDYLGAHANVVPIDDVIEAGAGGRALPPNPVLITFDDGERSVLEVAAPMLQARGFPAVAFVVAGLLDSDDPYWWVEVDRRAAAGGSVGGRLVSSSAALVRWLKQVPDAQRLAVMDELRASTQALRVSVPQLRRSELRELEACGVAIGSHTMGHHCLSHCETEKIDQEVRAAHEVLTRALGHPPASFAYPDGDIDGRVRDAVHAAGYRVAFLFDHQLCDIPWSDPLLVSRVRADAECSLDRFRILLSGLHPTIHRLRGGG